jgi:hypothetical protein
MDKAANPRRFSVIEIDAVARQKPFLKMPQRLAKCTQRVPRLFGKIVTIKGNNADLFFRKAGDGTTLAIMV